MLRDQVRKYNVEDNRNCAETILLIANEAYGLGLTNEDVKLVSAFGGGMGCGSTCGALAGCMAALGKVAVTDRAHTTAGFRDDCGSMVKAFEEKLGSTNCMELMEKYRTPEKGCFETIALGADVLEEQMKKHVQVCSKSDKSLD